MARAVRVIALTARVMEIGSWKSGPGDRALDIRPVCPLTEGIRTDTLHAPDSEPIRVTQPARSAMVIASTASSGATLLSSA
ncbi:hypothetical protein GCM10010390_21880 [Streptomyces mordarskii]|uniref:Uncharacterized protein n=1 Tax=Streptomyces mordarskii TaxID=1226758 RepID=A0ABN1CJ46_9ACTN